MGNLFQNCNELTRVDLRNFNTANVTMMNSMFDGCSKLEHLDIRNFDFTKVSYHASMFNRTKSDCEIIVKDNTAKAWIQTNYPSMTNIKTLEEYIAEGGE